jgi:hypothetical protein
MPPVTPVIVPKVRPAFATPTATFEAELSINRITLTGTAFVGP